MDPMQRQNQAHRHQHQGQPQHHDLQNQHAGGGTYGYSSHPQNSDFPPLFHNDLGSSFNQPWDIIDPRLQPNGFAQGPTSWHQNPMQATGELQTPSYGISSSNYGHEFAGNPNAFNYTGFGNQQQHSFTNPGFDPRLSFGSASLMNGSGFEEHRPRQYERRTSIQEQTISPSALQSYEYPPLPIQDETQSPNLHNDGQAAFRGSPAIRGPSQSPYGGPRLHSKASLAPKGMPHGNLVIKDPGALSEVTKAARFTGFVFLGGPFDEDGEPKVVLPRIPPRKRMRDILQRAKTDQGNNPWHPTQKPLLKRLKLAVHKQKSELFSIQGAGSGSSASASEVDSDDGSNDDSTFDEDDEPPEPSPLPASRPTDPKKAIEYDVVKCVWARKRLNLTGDAIRTALGEYWNIVKRIREFWKAEILAMQEAEGQKNQAQAAQRKARAAEQGQILSTVLSLTFEHGHRDIVEKLGENANLFLVFYQFIADRIKDGDYDSVLIANIFQLMTRCTTVDQALLEKTKLSKVFPKLLKRSNEKIKSLAQKVLDSAESVSKQPASENKSSTNVDPVKKTTSVSASTNVRASVQANGVTRPREITSSTISTLRKPISGPSVASKQSPAVSGKNAIAAAKGTQPAKSDGKASTLTTSSGNPSTKVKINHVVAKPTSLFAGLQSASKKPGTSNAAQKAAQQTLQADSKKSSDAKPSTPSAPPAPAPKPGFSFAETMANLTKPKEVPSTTKSAESGPPETEEEKKKRIRKEERRKLRVLFKPDDSLTEIRLFVHDPDEDLGHDDSMIRDVGDVRGEGRMLKMHKELETDEDEESPPDNEVLFPWFSPSAVDFSVIESDELARNCDTRGGKVEVKSKERAVQEQRELTTLMVYYSSLSDIPSTPRAPSNPYSGEPTTELPFGEPTQETKLREAQFFAMQKPQPSRPSYQPSIPAPATPDISALLQILNAQQPAPQPPQPQYQPPAPQSQPTGLEAIFAQFAGTKPAASAPIPQPTPGIDPSLQAALAVFNQQAQPTSIQPTYVQPQPAQSVAPDLQALFAQFSQPNAQQQQQQQQQGYGYQAQYQGEGNERKRHYEYEERSREEYGDGKRAKANGKKFFGVPRVPCKFYQEGKCKKGDECTFLHD